MPKPRWYLSTIVALFTCAWVNADRSPRLIFSRAAANDEDRRWPHGDVFYTFEMNLLSVQDRSFLFAIRDAMDIWEEQTCLRFFFRTVQPDYLEFTHDDENRCACTRGYYPCCSSELVGNNGGKQVIKLGQDCNTSGIVMHLVGHAIGFWHEHNRPDRDNYVSIFKSFVESNALDKFMKRKHVEVDHQADSYDYGSIMHPPRDYFSIIPGFPTIEVNNLPAFRDQGRPSIGQRVQLSPGDIDQANRLYHCPRAGIDGILSVFFGRAYNFSMYQKQPIAKVTAVDSRGHKYTFTTTAKQDSEIPTWNHMIRIGKNSWQFFRIQIWNESDGDHANVLTMSQTVPVTPGNHSMLKHCMDVDCVGYMHFDYSLVEDGDECSTNPCQNGGTCTDGIANFTCSCPAQYTGNLCEQRIWCTPNPCQNGGTCFEEMDNFTCNCPPQFTGDTCSSEQSNKCEPNPCQNNGTCIEEADNFTCNCSHQYTGIVCEKSIWCIPNPCLNGGRCDEGDSGPICDCPCNYFGLYCQHRNICLPNPCGSNGLCIRYDNSVYSCSCPLGYYGSHCQSDHCYPNPCQNGGTCNRHSGGFTCSCSPGYYGSHCQSDRCYPNPCQNGGTCNRRSGGYTCSCPSGYYDSLCQSDRCYPNPCQNGGTCNRHSGGYTCSCPPGYYDSLCQSDRCYPNPCQNGGTCDRRSNGYTCSCPSGYYGSLCESDHCNPNPCLNRGTCNRRSDDFTCNCPQGYYGSRCQSRDHCSPNPCQNGGICRNRGSSFTCICRGAVGKCCEHVVGKLCIYARRGTGLPDKDPLWGTGVSDPYLQVIASDYQDNHDRISTRTDANDDSPQWNECLKFSSRAWKTFSVRIWDEDVFYDDVICDSPNYDLNSLNGMRSVRFRCSGGYVWFDYHFPSCQCR